VVGGTLNVGGEPQKRRETHRGKPDPALQPEGAGYLCPLSNVAVSAVTAVADKATTQGTSVAYALSRQTLDPC